jgi:hypothetical protein
VYSFVTVHCFITCCGSKRNKRYDSTSLLMDNRRFIQALYRLTRIHQTGLTVSRGVGSSPQGFPRALASVGRRKVRGPISWEVPVDGTGTASVEVVKALSVPGMQKPPRLVGKTVPGPSRGGARKEEGEETSRSENKTHLVAAGLPGREPGSLPQRLGLPGMASTAVQALRWLTATTSSRDPTRMVKEQGPRRRTT